MKYLKTFEHNKYDNYRIRTKGIDIEEGEFILFKLKKVMNFYGWEYNTDEFYIGELYNIEIRPELHFRVITPGIGGPKVTNISSLIKKISSTKFGESNRNTLTNMQFKLMYRQMVIYEKGTLDDIIQKLKEIEEYTKYNL